MKPIFTAAIGGLTYLLHPQVLGTIQEDINPDTVLPVTLLKTEEIFNDGLDALLELFNQIDDVYSDSFTFALVEKPSDESKKRRLESLKASGAVKQTFTVQETPSDHGSAAAGSPFADLPSGPYILHGKSLHQAYRVYEDTLDAFTVGILPETKDSNDIFLDLSETLTNETYKPIAVPSRLYYPAPSIKKPLSGIRFSIPENFNVEGVPTTLSSGNWTNLHSEGPESTSDYVRFLIGQGAVIVGKTKAGQFAEAKEWTVAEPPVNPRGDGNQLPGGAGSGAASAMAGYNWLAYSIGQGAIDGVQNQAASYGVFSLRATEGALSQNGIQTSSPKFASAGMSSRNLNDFIHTAAPALNLALTGNLNPKRVIYPTDFFPLSSEKEQALTDEFVAAIEKRTGVKAERISLADTWAKNPPCKAKCQSLDEFLGNVVFRAFCYDFYHNYDKFREEFDAKFGKEPFTEATTQFQWGVGQNVTKEEYGEHLSKIALFKKWFNKEIASTTADSNDHAVVILPIKSQNSRKLSEPYGLASEQLAAILGTPQMTAPFAQLPMDGNRDAYLPFSASIMGPKGDDIMLVELMKRVFDTADWRIRVDTGNMTYPLGTNSRNVDDDQQDPIPDPGPGAFVLAEEDDAEEL